MPDKTFRTLHGALDFHLPFVETDQPALRGHDIPEHSHAYKMLENFICDEMRMSHIYQRWEAPTKIETNRNLRFQRTG